MIGTLIVIGGITTAGIAAKPLLRFGKRRRLLLTAAREESERRLKEGAAAFMESQRRYFDGHDIKTADRMTTPRAVDTGTIHLAPHGLVRWETDDACGYRSPSCQYGCGEVIIKLHEIAPVEGAGSGVGWTSIGRYCAKCGAWEIEGYRQDFNPHGPLGERLKGATNIFDALGPSKTEDPDAAWNRLADEEASLEARLNDVRIRRRTLAEQLGKPMLGGPMRRELPAKTET